MTTDDLVETFHQSLYDMMEHNTFNFDESVLTVDLFPNKVYSEMVCGNEDVTHQFREFGDTYNILKELSSRIGSADRGLYNRWFSCIDTTP